MGNSLLDDQLDAVRQRWVAYREKGGFELFVEFALTLNSLAELLNELRLPGLVRQCEGLENAALSLFGDPSTHPLGAEGIAALQRQIDVLFSAIHSARHSGAEVERRMAVTTSVGVSSGWTRPRSAWLIVDPGNSWSTGLREQLDFYGFAVATFAWDQNLDQNEAPFAIIFVPSAEGIVPAQFSIVRQVRARCPASQLFFAGVPREIDVMVELMRAGVDITIQHDEQVASLLSRILDLVQSREQEKFRVLVVEDSRVAVAQIQRALLQNNIDSQVIGNPSGLLPALDSYRPDLVLMDMYMPQCNGVEATRALRQLPAYQAVPIVYLSNETDIALQIEALRLGGDQFLTKPFNPVVLAATLKTRIERQREMQRSTYTDGMTGLLNHTAAKAKLDAIVATLPVGGRLSVAMIDIDRFKSVNDTYGHAVGDQVIRSLAWLLKGRLRGTDVIGRYGGEEFIIGLVNVDPDEAWVVLDRIRHDFSKLPQAHTSGTMRATFSGGIVSYPSFLDVTALTQAADMALLEAKRTGRNRIERAKLPPQQE